jgi:hypothetical protein
MQNLDDIKSKCNAFSDMLEKITSVDDKKKQLWRETYANAVSDRQNAYAIFLELSVLAKGKSTEYAVHGRTMTSCIERMSKANDQLLKLAELIAQAETKEEKVDPDDLYKHINGN